MTRIRMMIAAACAALTLSGAGAAQARQAAPAEPDREAALDELAPLIDELVEKLGPLALSLGVELPELMRDLGPKMQAAFPAPAADLEDWAFGINFENSDTLSTAALTPEERQPIHADAQACATRYPTAGSVVYFRRIRRDGMTGHQCVLRTYQGEMGLMIAETYAEGADRHMMASYDAAATTTNAEATRALFEPTVDANIALAIILADLALEAAIRKTPAAD